MTNIVVEIPKLNYIIGQMHVADIYWTLHLSTAEYTFF